MGGGVIAVSWSDARRCWRKYIGKAYLKNAYRVLLTRARQGMVLVVSAGDAADPTRAPAMYDPTFEYLLELGVPVLE